MSDAARAQRDSDALDCAYMALDRALENVYDAAFGMPEVVMEDLNELLKKYRLVVTVAG